MLVTFSGVDCAGKSTQIALLRDALVTRGERVSTAWFRPGYSREMNALKSLARRAFPRALPHADEQDARERVFARAGVSRTWVRMAIADTFLQYAVKFRAAGLAGATVIADRYLDDAALDLEYRFPELHVPRWPSFRLLRAASPRPRHAFLLFLPHAVMLARMAAKNEPFPDPPDVRDRRYAAYERLAASGRFEVVDANRPADVVHADVLARLGR